MPLDFEDLDAFFQVDEFATQVLMGPIGSETSFTAIFDNASLAVDDTMRVVSTTQPMLTCHSGDVANAEQGTRIVVNNVAYKIDDVQPDGTGISIVTLHKL